MDLAAQLQQETAEITGMDMTAQIARSFAASYRWNSHNVEGHWYGRSNQVWHDLVKDLPNMIVVPQYPLWYICEDEHMVDGEGVDEDGSKDRDSDEVEVRELEIPPTPGQTLIKLEPDDDQNCGQEEFLEDTMFTIPEYSAAELFPDFVILH